VCVLPNRPDARPCIVRSYGLCGVCVSAGCAGSLGGICGGEPPGGTMLSLASRVLAALQLRIAHELDQVK